MSLLHSRGFGFVTFKDPSVVGSVLSAPREEHILDNKKVLSPPSVVCHLFCAAIVLLCASYSSHHPLLSPLPPFCASFFCTLPSYGFCFVSYSFPPSSSSLLSLPPLAPLPPSLPPSSSPFSPSFLLSCPLSLHPQIDPKLATIKNAAPPVR